MDTDSLLLYCQLSQLMKSDPPGLLGSKRKHIWPYWLHELLHYSTVCSWVLRERITESKSAVEEKYLTCIMLKEKCLTTFVSKGSVLLWNKSCTPAAVFQGQKWIRRLLEASKANIPKYALASSASRTMPPKHLTIVALNPHTGSRKKSFESESRFSSVRPCKPACCWCTAGNQSLRWTVTGQTSLTNPPARSAELFQSQQKSVTWRILRGWRYQNPPCEVHPETAEPYSTHFMGSVPALSEPSHFDRCSFLTRVFGSPVGIKTQGFAFDLPEHEGRQL